MLHYTRLDAYLIIAGAIDPYDLEAQETLDQMVHSIRIHEAQSRELWGFVEAVQRHVEGSAPVEGKLPAIRSELHRLEAELHVRTSELPVTTILRARDPRAKRDGDQ